MSDSDVPRRQPATVYLVGAGPGDPNLITLRGVQCLQCADVIFYDYLANAQILKHARPEAIVHCLGKHGRTRLWSQAEINRHLVEAARRGQTVVRLKGGDPAVFARMAEECEALERAGIPYEIVPGITAAIAAGSCGNVPVTHRDHASAVAFFTGQQADHQGELDFAALAAFPGTLVVYMGVSSADYWAGRLLAHGKPPETPTAIIRRCSFPDQSKYVCRLDEVASLIERERLRPPAIIVVGAIAEWARRPSWFEQRPLFGRRILITRPAHQNDELGALLEAEGAEVLQQPAITIGPPADWSPVDQAISRLSEFDWLVFSSANGVNYFLQRLLLHGDLRRISRQRLAAIGPGTAAALSSYHLRADVVPTAEYRAEALAEALSGDARQGRSFLLLRASRGREVLSEQLLGWGGRVSQVVVYHSADADQADPTLLERLSDNGVDWITVTSSAIAQSLHRLLGPPPPRCRIASISPITSETLRRQGWPVHAEARQYTMQGVVEAIRAADRPPEADEEADRRHR